MDDFNGQWIEVFKEGRHTDDSGVDREFGHDFLRSVMNNYDPSQHEAPVVVGHPPSNGPAYGWVRELRVRNPIQGPSVLEARLGQVHPGFEELVKAGRLKKRSASFYTDPPRLRHIGFLGAQPPAVKGLKDIRFSDGDNAITFSEKGGENSPHSKGGEVVDEDKVVKSVTENMKDWFKNLFGGSPEKAASFSETEIGSMISGAVKQANDTLAASFSEKIAKLETENKELRTVVGSIGKDSKRARIVSFAERLGTAKFPPAFRRSTTEGGIGLVEFMERLAESDAKVMVISFSEEGGKKVEKRTETGLLEFFENFLENDLPKYIEFGEHFRGLNDVGNLEIAVDPARINELRQMAGLKTDAKAS